MGKNQHVVKSDDGWNVKGANNSKATANHKTQKEAINFNSVKRRLEKEKRQAHNKHPKV